MDRSLVGVGIFWMGWVCLGSAVEARQLEVTAAARYQPGGRKELEAWRYLLHLPADYEAQKEERWPMILFLHGRSSRGSDLAQLKRYGPPSFLDERRSFPFVVVSPQLRDGSWPATELVTLVEEVVAKYRIDRSRVYLTGVSLGGMGAWALAAAAPEKFAALAPVCGHGELSQARKMVGLPVWAFHGEKDDIVPIGPHRGLVEAIQKAGGQARLTVYPEGDHGNIIVSVYRQAELYDWFLKHLRDR